MIMMVMLKESNNGSADVVIFDYGDNINSEMMMISKMMMTMAGDNDEK